MGNERLIPVTKVWRDKGDNYGEKLYFFNPESTVEGIEPCKLKDAKGVEFECTKIFYELKFVTIKGTPEELFEKCRDVNLAICLVRDILKENMTVKQFLNQIEGLNTPV